MHTSPPFPSPAGTDADARRLPGRTGRRRASSLAAAFALLGACLTSTFAAASVPVEDQPARMPIAKPATLDPLASYEPQDGCRSTPLPGTRKLHSWLLNSNPGTRSSGMIRGCGVGGTSEHKDGRAIDWGGVDARTTSGRATAYRTIDRLLAPDKHGNTAALARKMGIMYLIYDDTIWSSYRNFEPRDYLNAGCKTRSTCSASLRHLDHVHISLSKAGANAQTSWYRWRRVPSKPVLESGTNVLDTASTAVYSMRVPANGERVTTPFRIRKGDTVILVGDGLVRHGPGAAISDAACDFVTDQGWISRAGNSRGLLVNGQSAWTTSCADDPDETPEYPSGPRTRNGHGSYDGDTGAPEVLTERAGPHTHQVAWTAPRTRRLAFRFADETPGNNDGEFLVHLIRSDIKARSLVAKRPSRTPDSEPVTQAGPSAAPITTERHRVRADDNDGALTDGSFEAGGRYRVSVWGTATAGGRMFDGGCVTWLGGRHPQHTLDLGDPAGDHLSLRIAGSAVQLRPRRPDPQQPGCSVEGKHAYTGIYTATLDGRGQVRIFDPYLYDDNTGSLTVKFRKLDS